MNDLTYQSYLDDPAVREAIEQDVNRQRHEAIDRYIVAPVQAAFRRLLQWTTPGTTKANAKPCVQLPRDADFEATIAKGQTHCFDNAKGFEIRVNRGCLWITQEYDSADYVLGAGETFRVTRDGATLAHAIRSASVRVAYTAESAAVSVAASHPKPTAAPRQRTSREWLRGVPARLAHGTRSVPQGEPA